mmetsp:Transcript_6540/g.23187  ORF Transcript_6540/g.23187 Transcript_6540/m.23187 type:complete len:246 (-) Transcript_6540:12-749(-)
MKKVRVKSDVAGASAVAAWSLSPTSRAFTWAHSESSVESPATTSGAAPPRCTSTMRLRPNATRAARPPVVPGSQQRPRPRRDSPDIAGGITPVGCSRACWRTFRMSCRWRLRISAYSRWDQYAARRSSKVHSPSVGTPRTDAKGSRNSTRRPRRLRADSRRCVAAASARSFASASKASSTSQASSLAVSFSSQLQPEQLDSLDASAPTPQPPQRSSRPAKRPSRSIERRCVEGAPLGPSREVVRK